jgi:hypothetical protein
VTTGATARGQASRGWRVLAAALLAAALLTGPMQSESAATVCEPPENPSATDPVTELAPAVSDLPPRMEETRIRWTLWHIRVVFGGVAVLEGQVVTDDGAVSEATVDLLAREAGSQKWAPVGSATTDPETGVFSFGCLRPVATTDYRAVYDGTLYYAGSQGDRTVGVARRVPDAMEQVAPDRFRFTGSVQPRYEDRPVLLQRKSCSDCRWRTVARRDTSTLSEWRFTIDVSQIAGQQWFRVVVPPDERYVRSLSDRVWRFTRR